jgi:CBS domain-containing protein
MAPEGNKMTIRSLSIVTSASTIAPHATVMEALQIMIDNRTNHVPVCDGESYIGLISVNDILQKLLPIGVWVPHGLPDLKFAGDASRLLISHFSLLREKKVSEILNHALPLDENCPLLEAALLLSSSPTPLPVVNSSGKLLGMLSRRGLLEQLAKMAEK